MAKNTELVKEPALRDLLNSDTVQRALATRLGSMAQANNFVTTVLEIVRNNKMLVEADPKSVLNASMTAVSLNLPINSNLGFAYIVPYNQKQSDGTYMKVAQFQMGYKGFVQLAQRSGQFKTISASPIYEGQIVEANPLTGYVFDFTKQDSKTIVGFAGYFKLLNGFEKVFYMSTQELQSHGKKYSQTYRKYNSGLWETDFEAMAVKTVLKLLLSKFAPLSTMPELQTAIINDQAVIDDNGGVESYVDNQEAHVDLEASNARKEAERIITFINNAKTKAELEKFADKTDNNEAVKKAYVSKLAELSNDRKASKSK